jgi:HK97 family phage major capsid protein
MRKTKMTSKTGKLAGLVGRSMTRAVTVEQINASGESGRRGLIRVGEVRKIDEAARTVELAFSSEIEVDRWFGIEVLSHDPASVRMGRMSEGAAVLVNHDWDDQIGVVESASIDADRRGRAVVKFGRSTRASEVFQDVVDGIRRHVSVGYLIHKIEVEERAGQADMVRVLDWEPFEVSIVAVAADPSVGIGREMGPGYPPEEGGAPVGDAAPSLSEDAGGNGASLSQLRSANMTKILRDDAGNLVRAKVGDDGAILEVLETLEEAGAGERQMQASGSASERARVRGIMEMGEKYGADDLARDFVKEGKSDDEFQRALLDHIDGGNRNASPLSDRHNVGLNDKEAGQFSFIRAIRALSDPTNRRAQEAAAFEFEASEAAAQKMGRSAEGIMVPPEVLNRAINAGGVVGAGDTGGNSIATDLMSQSFIDMLRNRAVMMRLATPLSGLVGNVDIPTQASGAAGYWIGEDDDATPESLELGQLSMSPKTVAAFSEITRKLLKQSSVDMEALVRRDLASALALTIDAAGFYGTGATNQPKGIINYAGINAVDFAGAGSAAGLAALPTYSEVVAMESAISSDNADVNSMHYVMGSGMRGHLKTTEKFDASNGAPIWEPGNTVNGYGTEVTNQVAAGDLFFGNFADVIVGMWGGLDITVDPYSNSKKGRLRIVTMQDVDILLRRVESFCYGSDAT